ncbi:MAG: histidine kinase [Actinomycetota bacterium]|nr:histidine kinase [Actinomycetota bacterium]
MSERLREWSLELYVVGAVFSIGVIELARAGGYYRGLPYLVMFAGMLLAVALTRTAPGAALGVIWLVGGLQVAYAINIMLVELAVAYAAFGTARWGRPVVVVLSGLSMPVAAVIGAVYANYSRLEPLVELVGYEQAARFGRYSWVVLAALLGVALLGVPWLAGLTLRFRDRARASQASQVAAEEDAARAEVAAEQSREIAELREDQARLARDVHDVVGHSLAVILAQAESAQYLRDADTEKLKQTMENIATSARSSLQDVRHVLTPGTSEQARPGSLEALVAGVNESGHEVVSSEVGAAQPLPPELEVVAYRVLQEMLTNAIKHGRRDEPVFVERHWEGELRIEVRNVIDTVLEAEGSTPGQGLEGMRRRLESVGGRLDVRRREESGGATFTVTAWVPVRSR